MCLEKSHKHLLLLLYSSVDILSHRIMSCPWPTHQPSDSINSICGFIYCDDGLSIACDSFLWYHAACFNVADDEVSGELCCVPRSIDRGRAFRFQKTRQR